MKIAIIGAGALGSLFGGLLSKSGEEVWLFDPLAKEHIAAINSAGLIIEEEGQEERIAVKGTTRIEEIGEAELVALFAKAPFTEEAIKGALPAVGRSTQVLSLQNGLGIIDILEGYINRERLLRGVTAQGSTLLGPGRIRHAGRGPTHIGRLSKEGDGGRLQEIVEIFNCAGIETYIEQDIRRLVWRKLLINVGINALTAIFDVRNGALVADKDLNEIMHGAVCEALGVAQGCGLDFSLNEVIREVEEVCHLTAENISSMLQDVRRENMTEIDYINGAIVREGERSEIKTPLNRLLVRLVKELSRKGGKAS
jgi:2-dehydropantoate 2-reductase